MCLKDGPPLSLGEQLCGLRQLQVLPALPLVLHTLLRVHRSDGLSVFSQILGGGLAQRACKFHVLFLMFVALMFFVSLMFLFSYHCWLVAKNRSTLEAFSAPVFISGPDRNGFNVGLRRNLRQVFGENRRMWFIPVFTSQGNGHYFPLKNHTSESHNPLLANEDMWEESGEGSDEESLGESQDPSVTIEMEE